MVVFFPKPKPWLDLYCTDFATLRIAQQEQLRLSSSANTSSEEEETSDEPTPIPPVQLLPAEVLRAIFAHLEPEHLSTAAQVCTKWLAHAYEPHLWRRIAHRTWPRDTTVSLERQLHQYKTWRKLATLRPRLRTNAIYVIRHQSAKTTSRAACSEPLPPVFLVTCYRFLRFYSDGTVVSLTSPDPPDYSYKRVRRLWTPSPLERDKPSPRIGTFELEEHTREVVLSLPMTESRFPDMRQGTMHMRFWLEGTSEGAFNRLTLIHHYAIMDTDGGELVKYNPDTFGGKSFRLIPLHGFKERLYREFPKDDQNDLAQWYEMKRARVTVKQQNSSATH